MARPAVLALCHHDLVATRKKRSISLPPDLDEQIAAAAAGAGVSYSSRVVATARKEFTVRAGLAAAAQYEDEHGAFTPDGLAAADQWAAQALDRGAHTGPAAGSAVPEPQPQPQPQPPDPACRAASRL
jgi:hypothetical protein